MRNTFAGFGLITVFTMAGAAHADVGVTGEVGSTGVGAHATMPLAPQWNARIGMSYLGYTHSDSSGILDYGVRLKSNTYDALLDWYPRRNNPFRITAGLSYNGNSADVQGKSNLTGSYNIMGRIYTAADAGKIEGKVDFRKTAPYLGIGWGNAALQEKGWSFSIDAGVLFQGTPNVSLANTGCTAPALLCNQLAANVARERITLTEDANRFKAYPVVRFGLSYRF